MSHDPKSNPVVARWLRRHRPTEDELEVMRTRLDHAIAEEMTNPTRFVDASVVRHLAPHNPRQRTFRVVGAVVAALATLLILLPIGLLMQRTPLDPSDIQPPPSAPSVIHLWTNADVEWLNIELDNLLEEVEVSGLIDTTQGWSEPFCMRDAIVVHLGLHPDLLVNGPSRHFRPDRQPHPDRASISDPDFVPTRWAVGLFLEFADDGWQRSYVSRTERLDMATRIHAVTFWLESQGVNQYTCQVIGSRDVTERLSGVHHRSVDPFSG